MLHDFEDFYKQWKYWIFFGLLGFTLIVFVYLGISIYSLHIKPKKVFMSELTIDSIVTTPDTRYAPTKEYFENFATVSVPEAYSQWYATSEQQEDQKYIIVDEHANFNEESASFDQVFDVSDANRELYDIADKYYQVYWGNQRVSPIYPLAVANVETGSRADHSITWSALFPSKYVDINLLYTMDVTTVLSEDSIYNALSKESSTRDRGALQMSPTYGTGSDYFNSMMSGTEKEKLSSVSSTHSAWMSGASSKPGDRFYVPDVCLRLSAANTDAIQRMTSNDYTPDSDMQLIAMLAMYHHRSGVWSDSSHTKSIGEWKSGEKAFEYSQLVSSRQLTQELRKYALEHTDKFWIDADTAKQLFKDSTGRDMSEFATKTLVCTYPIKVLYAYIKLCIMYAQ